MSLFTNVLGWIKEISGHLKTEETCDEAVRMEPYSLEFVPDHLKTEEMCKEAVHRDPYILRYVPDHLKTQEMCEEVIHVRPAAFFLIPDHFKTQEMCIRAVKVNPWQLYDVRDWFVILQEMQYEDFDDDDDEIIKWHDGYKKRKVQKAKIKEELLPLVWYHDRVMDWCMSEEEKGWQK